ncbi:MAG TPA: hypothetical protein VGP27_09875 [Mycobacterium sp.]|nr:hypothetical protein [Mycobacterium sp.]
MPSTIGKPVAIFAAATALSSFGVLATAASAQAAPSAVCTFARDTLVVNRSDGQMVTPDTQVGGTGMGPKATLFHMQQGPFTEFDKEAGDASGSIHDYHISFTRGAEQYEGEVTTNGGVTGWIQGGGKGNWSSPDGSVNCSSSTNGGLAKVNADVDVYDQPNGDTGKVIGMLTKDTQVNLVEGGGCPPDDWCQITGTNVPTGNGWAWGSFFSKP